MKKQVHFSAIKKLWKTNKNPVQIYIHSAFCKSICKYCCYRGTELSDQNESLYHKYFYKYLPKQIDKYKKIIDNQYINSIYFGGGTPNIEKDLANLMPAFEKIRDVKCNEKIIELHMGLPITDKAIDILKKEHFTTVILCQQTFDKKKLEQENRVNIANNDLNTIIKKFHDAGINVGMDFIAFADDPNRITNDINSLLSIENKPDEITVALSFKDELNYFFIKNTAQNLLSAHYALPDYNGSVEDFLNRKVIRFVQEDKLDILYDKLYSFISYLSEINSREAYNTSILGIGSLPDMIKQTFSKVLNTTYCETWDGRKTKYTLYQPPSYKEQIKKFLDCLPSYLPKGASILIKQYGVTYEKEHLTIDDNSIGATIVFPSELSSNLLKNHQCNMLKEVRQKLDSQGLTNVILKQELEDKIDISCLQ